MTRSQRQTLSWGNTAGSPQLLYSLPVPRVGCLTSIDTGYKEPPTYQKDSDGGQNVIHELSISIVVHGIEGIEK